MKAEVLDSIESAFNSSLAPADNGPQSSVPASTHSPLQSSPVQILNKTSPTTTSSVVNEKPLQQAPPAYELQNERVRHRVMLEYIAKGHTDKEIAAMMGCSAPMVGYIRKQPRYQEGLLNEVKRKMNEDQEVVEFIKANVVKAVTTLASVMSDSEARDSDRISAAEALLNRRYGKPNQPVNAGNTVDLNHLSDADLAKMLPETNGTQTSPSV